MLLRRERKRSFFTRFLYSYIFILFFPVLTAFIFYGESVGSVYEEAISANRAIIGQTTLILDKSLEDSVALLTKLNIDNDFTSLTISERPLDGRFYYKMEGVVKNLNSHFMTRAFLAGYFIYLPDSEQVLVNNTSYSSDFFFRHMITYRHYDKADWLKNLEGNWDGIRFLEAGEFLFNGYKVNLIPLVMRIPIQHKPGTYCLAVVFLDNDVVNEYLSRAQIAEDVSIYVSTREGNPVTRLGGSDEEFELIRNRENLQDGDRIETEGGRKLTVTVKSDYSGLSYTVLTPEKVLLHRLHYIRNTALVVSFCTILIGLMLSLFFSSRNARPLVKLLDVMKGGGDEEEAKMRDPFEALQESVSNLVHDNLDLSDRMTVQKAHLQEITLQRLLNGEFKSVKAMEKSLSFLSLDLKADLYTVVRLNLFPAEESQTSSTVEEELMGRLILDDLLQNEDPRCKINIITMREAEFALIFSWNGVTAEEGRRSIESRLTDLLKVLNREYGLNPQWGGGTFVTSLDMISISHDCAKTICSRMDRDELMEGNWYVPSKGHTRDIQYSLEVENRIIYLVKAGKFNAVCKILDSNIEQNEHIFGDRNIKNHYLELLRNTFYRMNLKAPLFGELCLRMHALESRTDLDSVEGEIRNIYGEMCHYICSNKKSRNSKLKDDILEYLNENYHDINISLITVSSLFNVSSGYLSHFFKEQTGGNFSSYLENLRITKAVELLDRGDRKIQEIQRDVGYTNAYSFRRAFKKVTGMSPSQYREK